MALKGHPARKVVVVTHYAMGSGTPIVLVADEVLVDLQAVLEPPDLEMPIF